MWLGNWQLILFALHVLHVQAKVKYNYAAKFSANFTPLTDLVTDAILRIDPGQPYPIFTFEFTLTRRITHFNIEGTLDMLRKDNRRIRIREASVDGCKFLAKRPDNALLELMQRKLHKACPQLRQCPLEMKHYVIANLTAKQDELPPRLPYAEFVISLKVVIDKVEHGLLKLRGSTTAK